VINFILR